MAKRIRLFAKRTNLSYGRFVFFLLVGGLPAAYCSALRSAERRIPSFKAEESVLLADQLSKTDSLKKLLLTAKEDTNKVNTLNELGWELMYSNPDTSILIGNEALFISERLQWKKGSATSLNNLGAYYYLKGDYSNAMDCYFKVLKMDEELKDKTGMAKRLGNIGLVYHGQGNYPKALDYYFRALKMAEELGYKNSVATNLGNIGNIYYSQGDYPKALDYYFKTLKIDEELGDKNGIAADLGSMGIVYDELGDYPKALDHYFKVLKMAEELGSKNLIATCLGNIGSVYQEQASAAKSSDNYRRSDSLYKKALDYYFKALKMREELGAKNLIASTLGNIGSLYSKAPSLPPPSWEDLRSPSLKGRAGVGLGYALAEKYLLKAIAIDSSIGAKDGLRIKEEYLSQLYDTTRRYQLALEHYKKAMVLKDSIFSQENKKQLIRKEMTYEFEKKEAKAKAEQEKKDAVQKAEARRQKIVFILTSGFLILVLVFTGFIARAYLQIKKKNKEIALQKQKIEEKQNEILASIRYAKRIQDALLPRESYIEKTLNRLKAKMPARSAGGPK